LASAVKRLDDGLVTSIKQRLAFRPTCDDIGQDARTQGGSFNRVATMGNEIHLEKTRLGLVPVSERPDGDLVLKEFAGFCC
jgi:hypothetical protein